MQSSQDPVSAQMKAQQDKDRRLAALQRDQSTMSQAAGLTSDLNALYGISLFGKAMK